MLSTYRHVDTVQQHSFIYIFFFSSMDWAVLISKRTHPITYGESFQIWNTIHFECESAHPNMATMPVKGHVKSGLSYGHRLFTVMSQINDNTLWNTVTGDRIITCMQVTEAAKTEAYSFKENVVKTSIRQFCPNLLLGENYSTTVDKSLQDILKQWARIIGSA